MKIAWVLLGAFNFVFCMDRPPQRAAKPAAQPPVETVLFKMATDFLQSHKLAQLLDKGVQISLIDLEQLVPLASETGYNFWLNYGIDLLLKSQLQEVQEVESLKKQATKVVRRSVPLEKYRVLPTELRHLVISGNFEAIVQELENYLDVTSQKPITDKEMREQIAKKKAELLHDLWSVVIAEQNVPFVVRVIKRIRQDIKKLNKNEPEPQIISTWTKDLVQKICNNILQITQLLKQEELLTPLINKLDATFARELRIARDMNWDMNDMITQRRILLGLLRADPETCPIFVTEQILKMVNP